MRSFGIGMVGYKFMGRAHAHAYRNIPMFFPEVPEPILELVAGRDEEGVARASGQLGARGHVTDWKKLVTSAKVDIVDICAPGFAHAEIALAAAAAGKHVVCEKPLANTLDEARQMLQAVEAAGVQHSVIFNYRYCPAVRLAHELVASGRLGELRHFRGWFLQDWIVNPEFPLVWRLQRELAGSGALGDLGAHIIDLARYLVGDFEEVCADMKTFVKERPLPEDGDGLTGRGGAGTGAVTVDDAVTFLARLRPGVMATFEATRMAPGHRCTNAFEINGSRGSVRFDFERMNELQVYLEDDEPGLQGFRTVNVNDAAHPYGGRWWPPGHGLGYDVTFIHQLADLLGSLDGGPAAPPTFADGLRCQEVLDAVERSARTRAWTSVEPAMAAAGAGL